jgi:hypothetical protein
LGKELIKFNESSRAQKASIPVEGVQDSPEKGGSTCTRPRRKEEKVEK